MTQPVFCYHPNAVQTQEMHPGGVSTYLREHRGRRHRVKRRYTEPMVLVERRCPDCPAYAAMTVQPGWAAELRLSAWIVGEQEEQPGAGLWQLGAPDKPYDQAALKDWSRNALCANCQHVGGLHRQEGCVGNTVTQRGPVECRCGWFRNPGL